MIITNVNIIKTFDWLNIESYVIFKVSQFKVHALRRVVSFCQSSNGKKTKDLQKKEYTRCPPQKSNKCFRLLKIAF